MFTGNVLNSFKPVKRSVKGFKGSEFTVQGLLVAKSSKSKITLYR
jgi:hypothetical protein